MDSKKRRISICFCIIIILTIIIPPQVKSSDVKAEDYELPLVTGDENETNYPPETATQSGEVTTTQNKPEITTDNKPETTTNINQEETTGSGTIDINTVTIDESQLQKTLEYNAKSRTPIIKLSYGDRVLYPSQDYMVEYDNNLDAGIATVTVTGIGDFTSSFTRNFEILKKPLEKTSISVVENKNHTITVQITNPEAGKSLIEGVDYTYTTKTETSGDIVVTIKASEVNYTGTVTKTLKGSVPETTTEKIVETTKAKVITVGKTEIKKIKNIKKKRIKLTWKKVSKASGYEIRYSEKKSMKNASVKIIRKNIKETSLKKLIPGKKYYVQIRAYRIVSKKYYYSPWSTKKKIRIIK